MLNSKTKKKNVLPQEILQLLFWSGLISIFFFKLIDMTASSVASDYVIDKGISLSDLEMDTLSVWIKSISFSASVILFLFLFLMLVGRKFDYLKEITKGVNLLREQNLDYRLPIEGSNELTVLAESINYMVENEKKLKQRELELAEAKIKFMRNLSHDIRTPLTSIMSYTEILANNAMISKGVSHEELEEYLLLMKQKSTQIKLLTEQLLDEVSRKCENVENGKLLMYQLICEWEEQLEDDFDCRIDLSSCEDFSAELVVDEFRRILDNLVSNIRKYADPEKPVTINVETKGDSLIIRQSNNIVALSQAANSAGSAGSATSAESPHPESYGIGLESIKSIAARYDGQVNTTIDTVDNLWNIEITIKNIKINNLQNSSEI